MADLNIPNLNKKSDKYLFKNKLPLRRKSKKKLISESLIMTTIGLVLIYINHLIPKKSLLIENFSGNLTKSFFILIEFSNYFLQSLLVIFIFASSLLIIILLFGSFSRIIKLFRRNTKTSSYK